MQHDADAAEPVGERPGEPGADGRAEQRHRRPTKPMSPRRASKLVLDRVDRAVDDRGVEAEQEAAERGHSRDEDDPPEVRTAGLVCCHTSAG